MTEFALILPVFVLVIAGVLSVGRVGFFWIEANSLANETARWAVVDRESRNAPSVAAGGGAGLLRPQEFQQDVKVCIDLPVGTQPSGSRCV